MATVDLPSARRLAVTIVLSQALLTALIALGCLAALGPFAAKSAALGGGINVLANLAMAVFAFGRPTGTEATRVARSFYVGEGAKLAVMIAGFVVVLSTTKVAMAPLFGAYVATFFVYWLALANVLPPLGGSRSARAG